MSSAVLATVDVFSGSGDAQCWQDKEVRFDVNQTDFEIRVGEKVFARYDQVEDSKGSPGVSGQLIATNLRLTWQPMSAIQARKHQIAIIGRRNISIGYYSICDMKANQVDSKLFHQPMQALLLRCLYNEQEFEFMLTGKISENMYGTISGLHRAYVATAIYRELRMKTTVVQATNNGYDMILLKKETLYDQASGVWNLSRDAGTLGVMFITNIRMVWYSENNINLNVSVPYLRMIKVSLRKSKYGVALVLEAKSSSGTPYNLGFRLDPYDRLQSLGKQILNHWKIYLALPIYGAELMVEHESKETEQVEEVNLKPPDEDLRIVDEMDTLMKSRKAQEVLTSIEQERVLQGTNSRIASRAVSRVNLKLASAAASKSNLSEGTVAATATSTTGGTGQDSSHPLKKSMSSITGVPTTLGNKSKSDMMLMGKDYDDEFGRVLEKEENDMVVFSKRLGLAVEGVPALNEEGNYFFTAPDVTSLWKYMK